MKFISFIFILLLSHSLAAQKMTVQSDSRSMKYALVKNDSLVTDFIFSEISEFSENKAYAAKGELYAYIDTNGKALSPFIFAVANNFKAGYAIVGDSTGLGLINSKMQVLIPFRYQQVMLPKLGLCRVQSKQGLWGAYDTLGNIKLPPLYELAPVFNSLEYIIIKKGDQYGVVNDCHEVVFNTSYQYISRNGLAYRSGKYLRLF